jgi:hypothetical protein
MYFLQTLEYHWKYQSFRSCCASALFLYEFYHHIQLYRTVGEDIGWVYCFVLSHWVIDFNEHQTLAIVDESLYNQDNYLIKPSV